MVSQPRTVSMACATVVAGGPVLVDQGADLVHGSGVPGAEADGVFEGGGEIGCGEGDGD